MQAKKENMGLKGIHTITLARPRGELGHAMQDEIKALEQVLLRNRENKHSDYYKNIALLFRDKLRQFNLTFGFKTMVIENVTPTEGRVIMARALAGDLSAIADIEINYTAVGTNSTAPAIGDGQLGAELTRKLISSSTYASNIAYITGFYAAGEGTGTLQEHGLFIAGTAAANSGSIISRLLLGGIVKGALDTLTIETSFTIADA